MTRGPHETTLTVPDYVVLACKIYNSIFHRVSHVFIMINYVYLQEKKSIKNQCTKLHNNLIKDWTEDK